MAIHIIEDGPPLRLRREQYERLMREYQRATSFMVDPPDFESWARKNAEADSWREVVAKLMRDELERQKELEALPPGVCRTCKGEKVLGSIESQRFFDCPDCK